jgi:hypothetical protein
MKIKNIIPLFLICYTFIIGCDFDTVSPGYLNYLDSLNILWTDEWGNALGGDTTDWCEYSFGPAYPNPVYNSATGFSVRFNLQLKDTVTLFLLKTLDDTIFYLKNEPYMPGLYTFQTPTTGIGTGVKQLQVYMRRNNNFNNGCRNYGDIWIK